MDSDQPKTKSINALKGTDSNQIRINKVNNEEADDADEIKFLKQQIENLKEEKNRAQFEFKNVYACIRFNFKIPNSFFKFFMILKDSI